MRYRRWKAQKQKAGRWNNPKVKDVVYCGCAHKQKHQFDSEKAALQFIKMFVPKGRQKIPIRAYECPCCVGKWHVTSQPLREDQKELDKNLRIY